MNWCERSVPTYLQMHLFPPLYKCCSPKVQIWPITRWERRVHQAHWGDLAEPPLQLQQQLAFVASHGDTAQLGGIQRGSELQHFPPPKAHSPPKLLIQDTVQAMNQLPVPNKNNKHTLQSGSRTVRKILLQVTDYRKQFKIMTK